MIPLRSRALQHQQSQPVLSRQHQFRDRPQPFLLSGGYLLFPFKGKRGRGPVDVHTHRRAHAFRTLQRSVLVGQTAVVHLQEFRLLTLITTTNRLHHRLLLDRITEISVLRFRKDGAHHLGPILIINSVYTHSII